MDEINIKTGRHYAIREHAGDELQHAKILELVRSARWRADGSNRTKDLSWSRSPSYSAAARSGRSAASSLWTRTELVTADRPPLIPFDRHIRRLRIPL